MGRREGAQSIALEIDSPTDGEAMKALARGELESLGVLYLRYGKLVYSVVTRYVPGLAKSDVEDLCQEVFLALADRPGRYSEIGQLRAWLCGIAIRKARELRRKQWLHRTLLGRFFGPAPTSESDAGGVPASDARHDLGPALSTLPDAFREVTLLSLVEGLSGEEIAAALQIPINTVWTRLHRGRALLRTALVEPKAEEPQ